MRVQLRLKLLVLIALLVPQITAAQDVGHADEVLIVRNPADKRFWQADPTSESIKPPLYPKALLGAGISGCVAIGFYIEPDGSTSSYRVLQSIVGNANKGIISKKGKRAAISLFGNALVQVMKGLRYMPGPENPTRKRGFSQLHGSFSAESMPLSGSCDIPDLGVFLGSKIAPQPTE